MNKTIYSITNIDSDPEDYKTLKAAKKAYDKNPENYLDDICIIYSDKLPNGVDYISLDEV